MENQHRKITGYRELSQEEIDLMNEIKAKGEELQAIVYKVYNNIQAQNKAAQDGDTEVEKRLVFAEPARWASIGVTNLQTGLMALTRAVAQPTSF